VLEASFGDVAPELVFGGREHEPCELPVEEHAHADGVAAHTLLFEKQLDRTAFGVWLTMLLAARGSDVLRVKGLLNVGTSGPPLLNGVQHVVHPPEHLDAWPDDDRCSRIVFIGRGFDGLALEASLRAFDCAAVAPERGFSARPGA
jgi:G3E family GTPase